MSDRSIKTALDRLIHKPFFFSVIFVLIFKIAIPLLHINSMDKHLSEYLVLQQDKEENMRAVIFHHIEDEVKW